MTKDGYANLTLILCVVAAVLSFAAALVGYVRHGEVRFSLIMAGLFMLAFGFALRSRSGSGK